MSFFRNSSPSGPSTARADQKLAPRAALHATNDNNNNSLNSNSSCNLAPASSSISPFAFSPATTTSYPSSPRPKSIANFKSTPNSPSLFSSSSTTSAVSSDKPPVPLDDPHSNVPYTEHLSNHSSKKSATRSSSASIYSVNSSSKGARAFQRISSVASSATSSLFKTQLFGGSNCNNNSSSSSSKKQQNLSQENDGLFQRSNSTGSSTKFLKSKMNTAHKQDTFRSSPGSPAIPVNISFQQKTQQQQQQSSPLTSQQHALLSPHHNQQPLSTSSSPVQYPSSASHSPFIVPANVSTISDTPPAFITQQHRSRHPSVSSTHSISPVTSHQSFSKTFEPRALAAAAVAATSAPSNPPSTNQGTSSATLSSHSVIPPPILKTHMEQYTQFNANAPPPASNYPTCHIASNQLPSPPFQSPDDSVTLEDSHQQQLVQILRTQQQQQFQPHSQAVHVTTPSSTTSFSIPDASTLPPPPSSEFIDTVIARFPFSSDSAYSLALKPGDVIKVLLKIEGWWDGVNSQGQRGWFPSNYTLPLSENQLQFLSNGAKPDVVSEQVSRSSSVGSHSNLSQTPLRAVSSSSSLHSSSSARKDFDLPQASTAFAQQRAHQQLPPPLPPSLPEYSVPVSIQQPVAGSPDLINNFNSILNFSQSSPLSSSSFSSTSAAVASASGSSPSPSSSSHNIHNNAAITNPGVTAAAGVANAPPGTYFPSSLDPKTTATYQATIDQLDPLVVSSAVAPKQFSTTQQQQQSQHLQLSQHPHPPPNHVTLNPATASAAQTPSNLTPSTFPGRRYNPVFNNVFESTPIQPDMSSLSSRSLGSTANCNDGSRKGSVVSFMSSNSRNDDSEISFSEPPNLSDYRFVEGDALLKLSQSDSNSQLSEHRTFWNPYSNNQAKLFFYNPQLKLITNNIPFESVSKTQAAALASSPLPTTCPGPKDLASVSEHPTISSTSLDSGNQVSPLIIKSSGDPYKELLYKYSQKNYEYKNRTRSDSEYSITSLSSSLSIPFKYTDNIEHLKTWSSIVGRLELIASNMLSSLSSRDFHGISNSYESFSNIIAHISYMSGIPPSTVPASIPSNREISRTYRRMVTCLSKLGLSADIAKDKSEAFTEFLKKPRSSSVISTHSLGSLSQSSGSPLGGDRKFSIISELSESGEDADPYKLCARDTKMLLKCTKAFIKQFKQTLRTGSVSAASGNNSSFGALPVSSSSEYANSEFSNDDSASITSRGSVDSQASISYPVKRFRAGTWSNTNISPTSPNGASGGPRPPRRASIVPLEAYDSIIPLDYVVVTVLEHQRSMVLNILRQIFSLINNKRPYNSTAKTSSTSTSSLPNNAPYHVAPAGSSTSFSELKAAATVPSSSEKSYFDMKEDRRVLFVSSLNSLVAIVTNISNLLESLDLSVYQSCMHSEHKHTGDCSNFYSQVASPSNVQSLILLYDFLNVKQTIYDELLGFLAAVQSNDILEKDFIEHFANTLEATKVSSTLVTMSSSTDLNKAASNLTSLSNTPPSTSKFMSTNHEITEGAKSCANDHERIIKMRVMEMGIAVDAVVQTAALLAEERPQTPFGDTEGPTPGSAASAPTFSEDNQYPLGYYQRDSSHSQIQSSGPNSNRSRSNSVAGLEGSGGGYSMVSSNSSASKGSSKAEMPWFLKVDHADELILDGKNHVKGGTLVALVERLTQHDSRDAAFIDAFLLTFRSMMSPQQLFQMLLNRYTIQPPAGLTSDEFNLWTERKQKLIRFRVINILKRWLDEFWYEDPNSKPIQILLQSMMNFTVELKHQNSSVYEQIRNQIEIKMKMDTATHTRIVQNPPLTPPVPILPRNLKKIKLSDLDPLELARQLTLREFKLFEQITPFECLTRRQSKNKTRNNTLEGTPHIDDFIQNSNSLTNWVAAMILSYTEPKKRAQAIKYFTNVAEYCRQHNNFSSMMAIISALSSATIHRLKKTWVLVSEKTMFVLENMKRIMNSSRNFNEYRDIIRLVVPPVIPFFGVCLTDLTFLEDANSDYLHDDPNMINFSKRMKSADIISRIMDYQVKHYVFQEVPEIQNLLTAGYSQAEPIDSQYDLSLTLEPRVNTDERVTKLLEETGFL